MTKRSPIDIGTKERASKGQLRPELTGQGHEFHVRVIDSSTIDRLLISESIGPDEFDTLSRLHIDIVRASLHGYQASDYEPRVSGGQGQSVSEKVASARVKVNNILRHIASITDSSTASLVYNTALGDYEPTKPQLPRLRRGIEALFDFYETGD
jgi:hypothetical protein